MARNGESVHSSGSKLRSSKVYADGDGSRNRSNVAEWGDSSAVGIEVWEKKAGIISGDGAGEGSNQVAAAEVESTEWRVV